MAKRAAPAAIHALKEALAAIYWFKRDLRAFLTTALDEPTLLARVNWDDYKHNIVGAVVDRMLGDPRYTDQLLTLMVEVARIENFDHLARLEDGPDKVQRAQRAVARLKPYTDSYEEVVRERTQARERIEAAKRTAEVERALTLELESLKAKFYELVAAEDRQRRGYDLQDIMERLFEVSILPRRARFRS